MTTDELGRAERLAHIQHAFEQADATREKILQERRQEVHDAIEAGWTPAQIARATGLTPARISQIVPPDRRQLREHIEAAIEQIKDQP